MQEPISTLSPEALKALEDFFTRFDPNKPRLPGQAQRLEPSPKPKTD